MNTQIKNRYQRLWYLLKITINGFNVDTYFIYVKYESANNKALSLYFIPPFKQFPTFLSVHINFI